MKDKQVAYIADFEGLVDIVEHKGKSAFLVLDGQDLKIVNEVEEGVIYKPPSIEEVPWLLPRAEEVIKYYKTDNDKALYKDLIKYHQKVSDLSEEDLYHIFALWDIHTHLIDKLNFSPYIWLYAPYETGKTRTGKSLIYVARRGVYTSCLREAFLIRFAFAYRGSIFIDVIDLWRTAQANNTDDVLMLRCDRGAKLPRILNPKDKYGMTFYDVFGPTIIATNAGSERHLDTRSIKVVMSKSNRAFNEDMTEESVRPYRERLTALRARNMLTTPPPPPKLIPGRSGDLFRPFQQVADMLGLGVDKVIKELCLKTSEKIKVELSADIEGLIVEALVNLKDKAEPSYISGTPELILPIVKVTEEVNQVLGYKGYKQMGRIEVGHILKALGIEKIRRSQGMMIIYNRDKVLELAERYEIRRKVKPLTKVVSMVRPTTAIGV